MCSGVYPVAAELLMEQSLRSANLKTLIHIQRRCVSMRSSNHYSGYAGNRGVRWYILHDDAAGADFGAFTDV